MRGRGDIAISPLSFTRALVDRLPARTDERGPILVEAPAPDFHERTAEDILEGCDPPGTVWVFAAGLLIWKEHIFRVVSDVPSRHFVSLTPGGFEGFFAETATGQFRIPEDIPAIAEIASRHHLSFTGPPLSMDKMETSQ